MDKKNLFGFLKRTQKEEMQQIRIQLIDEVTSTCEWRVSSQFFTEYIFIQEYIEASGSSSKHRYHRYAW